MTFWCIYKNFPQNKTSTFILTTMEEKDLETKVRNFHIPPGKSILALLQGPKEKNENDKYVVCNQGKVPIQIEVVHSTKHIDGHTHVFTIKPGVSKTVELNEHFNKTILKVTNRSPKEEGVFSAEGGQIPSLLDQLIQILPDVTVADENTNKYEHLFEKPNEHASNDEIVRKIELVPIPDTINKKKHDDEALNVSTKEDTRKQIISDPNKTEANSSEVLNGSEKDTINSKTADPKSVDSNQRETDTSENENLDQSVKKLLNIKEE